MAYTDSHFYVFVYQILSSDHIFKFYNRLLLYLEAMGGARV